MARHDATEKATPKRRREARERGQVARSHDLAGAAVFLAIVIALHAGFDAALSAGGLAFTNAIARAGSRDPLTVTSAGGLLVAGVTPYVALLALAFGAAVVLAVVANVAQFGLLFAPRLLLPNLKKLDPFSGFQRLFLSTQTLIGLGKQLAKLGVVAFICWLGIKDNLTALYALAHAAPHEIVVTVEGIVYGIAVRVALLLLVVGIADYVWERRRLSGQLKMTKNEVRDEHRQSEGNPEAKQTLRQRQRAMARKRMMAAVPKATVVVTNPTHYAVALQWDEEKMDAPVLTAKGADLIAKRIRELAREHNVPILENPPLARTLYAKVDLDAVVPPDLYAAVAQVIAFVYRLKSRNVS